MQQIANLLPMRIRSLGNRVHDALRMRRSSENERVLCADALCTFRDGSDQLLRPSAKSLRRQAPADTPEQEALQRRSWRRVRSIEGAVPGIRTSVGHPLPAGESSYRRSPLGPHLQAEP